MQLSSKSLDAKGIPNCKSLLRVFHADPATTPLQNMPADYVARVKATHQNGDYGAGSIGQVCL